MTLDQIIIAWIIYDCTLGAVINGFAKAWAEGWFAARRFRVVHGVQK